MPAGCSRLAPPGNSARCRLPCHRTQNCNRLVLRCKRDAQQDVSFQQAMMAPEQQNSFFFFGGGGGLLVAAANLNSSFRCEALEVVEKYACLDGMLPSNVHGSSNPRTREKNTWQARDVYSVCNSEEKRRGS